MPWPHDWRAALAVVQASGIPTFAATQHDTLLQRNMAKQSQARAKPEKARTMFFRMLFANDRRRFAPVNSPVIHPGTHPDNVKPALSPLMNPLMFLCHVRM
jgi:hypothetical protein